MNEKMFHINKGIIFQKINDEFIGFDTDKSYIYTFNKTAEYIFKKLKSGWNEEKIIQAMGEKYESNPSTLRKDVIRIITYMEGHSILKRINSRQVHKK